ncbi:MAG: restriction endonuclease subunit S [Candidatus Sumerlaeia bacterium]|nr:restriction endonuclease subunit S [Candidatus Sumerlaeia bacterium]
MKKWKYKRLGEVATVLSGATPRTSVPEFWGGDLVWVTPKDLGGLDGIEIHSSERRITQAGFDSCSAQLVPPGSVIMSSRAPIGHLAINTVPVCTNQGCKSFVPSPAVDNRYLYWVLKAFMPQIQHMGEGCTFEEVSKAELEAFEIPVPPLEEQRRIVGRIEALTARLTQAQQARQAAIAEAETVFQRALAAAFADENTEEWQDVPATSLFEVGSGQVSPLEERYKHLPYLGPEHVEPGTGRIIGEQRSVEELKMKSGKHRFTPQDVVYSSSSAPQGLCTRF